MRAARVRGGTEVCRPPRPRLSAELPAEGWATCRTRRPCRRRRRSHPAAPLWAARSSSAVAVDAAVSPCYLLTMPSHRFSEASNMILQVRPDTQQAAFLHTLFSRRMCPTAPGNAGCRVAVEGGYA